MAGTLSKGRKQVRNGKRVARFEACVTRVGLGKKKRRRRKNRIKTMIKEFKTNPKKIIHFKYYVVNCFRWALKHDIRT